MSDLDELFSRLKTQQQSQARKDASDSPGPSIWENQMPAPPRSVTQPLAQTPTRQIMPRGATEQTMSNNLLTLLNINRKAPEASQTLPKAPDMTKTDPSMLDKLFLNKPPTTSAGTNAAIASTVPSVAATTPVPLEAPQPAKAGLFNYVNPFDQLHASSPLNLPQAAAPPPPAELPSREKAPISVAQKLENVGESVDKHVSEALAQATKSKDDEVTSNWSTAEDEDAKKEDDDKIEAYNFPMKPFVMLELQQGYNPRSFRTSTWTNATPVARLKKEFSHDDRTLATASQSHIVYTVVPTEKKPASGLKVIRQDDGKNKHIWSVTNERLCSVQISSTGSDTVLATGINGTIFYTELPLSDGSMFDETDLEAQGFVMTPPPNSDEPTTGTFATSAAIRTRAKLSNRNPQDYFAVARGRQVHLIAPRVVNAYKDATTYRVDTDKLLLNASFSINTGKAGKDFCFSEDDSILASLDKLGKVKFWDIRLLTSSIESPVEKPSKIEIKEPVFSFSAGAAPSKSDEKISPSSILFLDKERAYAKCTALRYLLIGYQQNHILQLWDLGLGKCVQELRFPESSASPEDASAKGMCSITYHPKTAIICVGHPGRNSVYFLHLSAPKYNLPPMNQATFLSYIARGDKKNVPPPESTAIMSGIREFSCSRVGQLRSLDILKTPYSAESQSQPTDGAALFELYLMHSKGVLGIPIGRADLGWDAKGKLVKPADAVEHGVVVLHELKTPALQDDKATPEGLLTKPLSKPKKDEKVSLPKPVAQPTVVEPITPTHGAASTPKTKAQAAPQAPQPAPIIKQSPVFITKEGLGSQAAKINQSIITPDSYKMTDPTRASSMTSESGQSAAPEKSVAPEMNGKLSTASNPAELSAQFSSLYAKLDSDRRIAEAAGAAKQDAMLRLVSSTLTDNVEASLHKIVNASIEQQVLPALTSHILATVKQSLTQGLQQMLPTAVQQQVKALMPEAVNLGLKNALNDATFIRAVAAETAKQLDDKIKATIPAAFQQLQATVLAKIDAQHKETSSSLRTHAETGVNHARSTEAKLKDFDQSTLKALRDSEERITQLLSAIHSEQSQLSARIDSLQRANTPDTPQTVKITKEESSEVQQLTELLNDGEYEQATIKWLQSPQQAELFDNLFVRINPVYLRQVSPLIALSVSAAVTSSFDSTVAKRLEWLSSVLDNMDINDPEIRDVIPKIMDVLITRLQGAYMQIAESQPTDQDILRKLASLNRQIGEIRKALP
ncbi:hypothetical protein AMS68_006907 [Peltaster fructicola]|uniref:EDC4-like protein pdc1 beta-propeller domain-containing protein n=1 Tax=Peltaster fructicola TaxID=286661 RepID=A0A6H0Y448_9PEZI|nr:hypothetical protein AMS68_006907 [Peltaster fructicola]